MKTYIKPNTEQHEIELQQMIANTIVETLNTSGEGVGDEDIEDLGKSSTMTTLSLWDEEEE